MAALDLFCFSVPLWIAIPVFLISVIYLFATWNYSYFKRLGIPGPKPIPLLGNMVDLMGKGMKEFDLEVIRNYGNVVGIYMGRRPVLVVSDVEILKQLLIKQFTVFPNRSVPYKFKPPANKMMFVTKDDDWRRIRNHASPAYTSGKLRSMSRVVNAVSERLVHNVEGTIEVRPVIGNFTMDIIASTAFGLDIDSQKNPDSSFSKMALKLITTGGAKLGLLLTFPTFFNFLSKFIGLSVFPQDAIEYFSKIVQSAIDHKKSEKDSDQSSDDLLQLLVNAELNDETKSADTKSRNKGLDHDEILGQCILFFFAAYDTVAKSLTFFLYNLAIYPDCQEKVYSEIINIVGNTEHPDIDIVKKLTYMDMALNETLRIFSPAPRTDRDCEQDIVINGVQFKKGLSVAISIHGLHHDPKVWPDPEKFDPERFSEEEKSKRDPMSFMPFGMGPRHCLGMRLGLLEMKLAVVHILKKYRVVRCERTPVALPQLHRGRADGVFLRFERRLEDPV